MTNQEAIKVLCWPDKQEVPISLWNEAIELAISALQAQEAKTQLSAEGTTSDLISRQAAIDAFMTATSDGDKAEWCRWVLKQLPSAQPDGWLEQNKDKILQSGMEGREIDFRIGGRLFAIREKAQ